MLALLSLLSISVYNTLSYYRLQNTEVINSVILQSTGPLMVVGFMFLIHGEPLSESGRRSAR